MHDQLAQRNAAAVRLAQQHRLDEAIAEFDAILDAQPDFAPALHNRGIALTEQGKFEQAESSVSRALEIDPGYVEAHHSLANVLRSMGKLADAEGSYRWAIALQPDRAESLHDLGTLLTQLKRPESAVVFLRQAIRFNANFLDGHNGLGLALLALGRSDEAISRFEEVLRISPLWPPGHVNLATAYKESGRLAEAIAEYEFAVALDPKNPSAHWNLALALLQAGDYERGFNEYEWRWRREQSPPRPFRQPQWDGRQDLAGKTLLLHTEQGLGDTIQFLRYAEAIKAKSCTAKLLLECPYPLKLIAQSCPGIDAVLGDDDGPLPPFDFHLPLLSAPHVSGTSLTTVPNHVPYLQADQERVNRWRSILHGDVSPLLKVGIVWKGNPHHQLDRFRSCPLTAFAPLSKLKNVRLYSLQRGPGTEELDYLQNRDLGIVEVFERGHQPSAEEWADTAALIASLDLVISVDTAPVHLAGAMRMPVWILLASSGDWRWLVNRADSPWYPTAKLFRQSKLGDWSELMMRVAIEISELAAERARQFRRQGPVSESSEEPKSSKLLTVLLGCYGEFPEYSTRALNSIAAGMEVKQHCDLLVGLNECCAATIQRARELRDAGVVDAIIDCSWNTNKDPMLRTLLQLVRTPYLLWLDDDSHFISETWSSACTEFVRANSPFDAAGYIHYWGPHRDADAGYMHYITSRPWWRGDGHYAPLRKKSLPFPVGGCFLARTEFLRDHDFPDRGMIKGVDDVALGELLMQTRGKLVPLSEELLELVKINDGARRGEARRIEDGWRVPRS